MMQQYAYSLLQIGKRLDASAGSISFSTLNLISKYWQVTSASSTFQWLIERVLDSLHWKSLLISLDDMVVIAPDFLNHTQWLEDLL